MSKGDADESGTLSPEEAFAVIGNETRIQILKALCEADRPLGFSELYDRIDYEYTSNFSFHLDKLLGLFVEKSNWAAASPEPQTPNAPPAGVVDETGDQGYIPTRRGIRIYQAIHSGAVTDDLVIEPSKIDRECPFCVEPVYASYWEERLERYCKHCDGLYGPASRFNSTTDRAPPDEYGYLGYLRVPPASVIGRSQSELHDSTVFAGVVDIITAGNGVCPRCTGNIKRTPWVCHDHDDADPICSTCHRRYAAHVEMTCDNCQYLFAPPMSWYLTGFKEVMTVVTDQDLHPIRDVWHWTWDYEERVRSIEPFDGEFTLNIGDETLTLQIDNDLEIVNAERSPISNRVASDTD